MVRKAMEKRYKSSGKRARGEGSSSSEFDEKRFTSFRNAKVFLDFLSLEAMTPSYFFNFASLERNSVQITEFFKTLGIFDFVQIRTQIYENLVREFYANLAQCANSDDDHPIVQSRVGGIDFQISEKLLNELFNLNYEGYSCNGRFGETGSDDSEQAVREFLLKKTVIEVNDDHFDNNDFGIEYKLLFVAITKCLMPKKASQTPLVHIDEQVIFRAFRNEKINFASIVINWMINKGNLVHTKKYEKRIARKAGLPFGSILTTIFQHFKIDLSKEKSTPVSLRHEITDQTLRSMKYHLTKNRGWILYTFLRDSDELVSGSIPPLDQQVHKRDHNTPKARLATQSKGKGRIGTDDDEDDQGEPSRRDDRIDSLIEGQKQLLEGQNKLFEVQQQLLEGQKKIFNVLHHLGLGKVKELKEQRKRVEKQIRLQIDVQELERKFEEYVAFKSPDFRFSDPPPSPPSSPSSSS